MTEPELPVNQECKLKLRFRFDYRGSSRPGRLFFGPRNSQKAADEARAQQVALLRSVPVKGVAIEHVDENR